MRQDQYYMKSRLGKINSYDWNFIPHKRTHFELGEEKINFSKQDVEKVKKFDEPGLKLMGFKPKNTIKHYYNIKSSYFIYPDDLRITGSSQLADALIKQLIAKDKVAIVRFVPRRTSMVRFCALLPQAEAYDADNFQTPPGFNLIFLPYADDIRKPDTVIPIKKPNVNREQITNAKLLVKALTFDFYSRNFENPRIQNFFSNLQAIALNEDQPEVVEDTLEPDEEGMKKYAEVIENFKFSVFGDNYEEPVPKTTEVRGKKKAEEEIEIEEKPPQKKPRATPTERVKITPPKKGRRKKKSEEEEEEEEEDDDLSDFIVDDLPKKKRRGHKHVHAEDEDEDEEFIIKEKKGKDRRREKNSKKVEIQMEIEDEYDHIEQLLKEGEVNLLKRI